MRPLLVLLILLAAGCTRQPPAGPPPHQIRIVGASAGLPFAEDVAERFTLARADSIAPLAQADGTASGIARFCGGLGVAHPDLVVATRGLTPAERRTCAAHGVSRIAEIRFGWTALVLFGRAGETPTTLSRAQAAAAIAGPARLWSEIDPALPALPIALYGPARRNAEMVDALLRGGAIRHDGAYHPLGADAALAASTVAATPRAVGLVPFAYAGAEGLRAIPLDGVAPSPASIADGRYPARAPLFLLVKAGEARGVPGLAVLLGMFAASLDAGGPFARAGLVPLDAAGREAARGALASVGAAALL